MLLLFLLLLLSVRIVKLNKRITWTLLPFSCTKRKILTFSVLQFSVSLCFTFVFHNYSVVIHPVKMVIDRQYRDKVFKGDSVCKIWSIWSFKTDHNYHSNFLKALLHIPLWVCLLNESVELCWLHYTCSLVLSILRVYTANRKKERKSMWVISFTFQGNLTCQPKLQSFSTSGIEEN